MGMIQTIVKACKQGVDTKAYYEKLTAQAQQLQSQGDGDGDKPDSAKAFPVTSENFDTVWSDQENCAPSNKETWRTYMQEGRMFAIEIDW